MNLPNKLTISRILLTFVYIFFLFRGGVLSKYIAFFLFIAASLTDLYDGRIARKRDLVTNFGKIMDPIADKILILASFIVFAKFGIIPAWMVAVVILREVIVTGIRLFVISKSIPLPEGHWLRPWVGGALHHHGRSAPRNPEDSPGLKSPKSPSILWVRRFLGRRRPTRGIKVLEDYVHARGAPVVLEAQREGKHKTVSQVVTVISILAYISLRETLVKFSAWNNSAERASSFSITVLMMVTVMLTLYSGISFIWKNRRVLT